MNDASKYMNEAMLVVQVITTIVIAATLVVYTFQLYAMKAATRAQNLIFLFNYLQSAEIRDARHKLFNLLYSKSYQTWNDADKRDAATVCASFDLAALMGKHKLVGTKQVVDGWREPILALHPICRPLIEERRQRHGPRYWAGFDELYKLASSS